LRPRPSCRLRVNIHCDTKSMTTLVSLDFWIDARLVAQTCVSPPHDLEIDPIQTIWLQLGFDVV